MKISELLEAIEQPKSNLASAPSLDDEPESDVEDQEDSGDIDAFISQAGDLGGDLYSLTIYNYSDDWANVDPGTPVKSVIERAAGEVNRKVVDAYLNQDIAGIANDRMISNMILNSRNGRMFAFSSGINAKPLFNPSVKSLVEPDQISVLKKIMNAGKRYYEAVTAFDSEYGFKPGYEADKKSNSAGESLIEELATPAFVKTKSITRAEVKSKRSADKQKWQDVLNDPNSSERRKMMATSHLKRISAQGY